MIIKGKRIQEKKSIHGCPNCIYLGVFGKSDIWICQNDTKYINYSKQDGFVFMSTKFGWNPDIDFVAYHEAWKCKTDYNGWADFFQQAKEEAIARGIL